MDLRETFATICAACAMPRAGRRMNLPMKLKISRSYQSQIEKGVYHVSISVIGKLTNALDAEPDEFLKRAKRGRPSGTGKCGNGSPPARPFLGRLAAV